MRIVDTYTSAYFGGGSLRILQLFQRKITSMVE
jgi:hypothetical protein